MQGHMPKSPDELVERFAELVPDAPGVQRKKMFGYPCAVLGGRMFMGLHGEKLVLKLPDAERETLLTLQGAEPFEPMPGRPMREFVAVSSAFAEDAAAIQPWIDAALTYATSQPAKPPAKKLAARRADASGER